MDFPAYSSPSPFVLLAAISVLLHSAMAAPPPPAPQPVGECVDKLVMFSPCLAFVSSPPNNRSDTVPSKCCDAFLAAIDSGEGSCLCHLLRRPRMLGFPLNESRVLSLPSVCSRMNQSLEALCSGSEAESPDSGISNPPDSALGSQPNPSTGLPLESNSSNTPPSLPPDSKNTGTTSSPPPQVAKRPPMQPISPEADPFWFPAAADQSKGSRFWFPTSILVLPFLISSCL